MPTVCLSQGLRTEDVKLNKSPEQRGLTVVAISGNSTQYAFVVSHFTESVFLKNVWELQPYDKICFVSLPL